MVLANLSYLPRTGNAIPGPSFLGSVPSASGPASAQELKEKQCRN